MERWSFLNYRNSKERRNKNYKIILSEGNGETEYYKLFYSENGGLEFLETL